MPTFKKILSLSLILIVVTSVSFLKAQRLWIPNIETHAENTTVEVPIYITVTDSLSSVQLSVLWDSEQLVLDTLIFAPHLTNLDGATTMYSVLSEQEMRAVAVSSQAGETDPFAPDSLLLTMHFRLTDKFTGDADIIFNPEFSTFFAHHDAYRVDPELQGGNISTAGNTTALEANVSQTNSISLFPNPVSETFMLRTEETSLRNAKYQLTDTAGKLVNHGKLVNGQGDVPDHFPDGTYVLTLFSGKNRISTQIIIQR
ncbi:T9SS type A sorting domain-containing protein [Neolewinella aurantiaca]|nr:T9SS type A sorting domain-containing protein [Neolewinella aurantiaca]